MQENTYVDDILESFETDKLARICASEISSLLKTGGFFIKEWMFSSEHEGDDYEISCVSGEHKNTSVLGSKWEKRTDSFIFTVKLNFSEKKRKVRTGPDLKNAEIPYCLPSKMTKREILSQLSGLWDPQGFAAPIIIKGKIRMRRLWLLKLDWDDPIPADTRKE